MVAKATAARRPNETGRDLTRTASTPVAVSSVLTGLQGKVERRCGIEGP